MDGITLEERLIQEFNISKSQAHDLAMEYSETQILNNIAYLQVAKEKGIVQDPIQYLVNAIKKDYFKTF